MEDSIGSRLLNAHGLGLALPVLGLLVALPAQGGGGWSKAVANYLYPSPILRVSHRVHSTSSGPAVNNQPVNIPSASPWENDSSKGGLGITSLPNELQVNILANLTIRDLLVCKHVCKHWQNLVTTVPVLACSAYRSCHPTGYVPALNDTIRGYHGLTRRWLNDFSEQGRKAVIRLDRVLASGEPHLPEQLFFAIANLLDETPAFNCRKVYTFRHSHLVDCTCFSPDQQHLLICSDHTITICGLVEGHWQNVDTLQQPEQLIVGAYFSPDGKYLVSCLANLSATIWALREGYWQQQTDWHSGIILFSPQFNADTTYLVTASISNNVTMYRLIDGQWQPLATDLDHQPVREAQFHPTEPDLLATCCHNTVIFWRSVDGHWQQNDRLPHTHHIVAKIIFSADGNRLMVRSKSPDAEVNIHIWHQVDHEWQKEAVLPLIYAISTASFSACGNYIWITPGQKAMEIWRRSGSRWEKLKLPEDKRFFAGYISADAQYLVTNVQFTRQAIVWRFTDEQLYKEMVIEGGGLFHTPCFSPHGNHMAMISADKKIASIWGVVAGQWQEKARLPHPEKLATLGFSPRGYQVFTITRDGTFNIWTLCCHNNQP